MKTPEEIRIAVQNQVWYSEDVFYEIDDYINNADDLTEEEKEWAYAHLYMHTNVIIK